MKKGLRRIADELYRFRWFSECPDEEGIKTNLLVGNRPSIVFGVP